MVFRVCDRGIYINIMVVAVHRGRVHAGGLAGFSGLAVQVQIFSLLLFS
jgi:hypothetical protein